MIVRPVILMIVMYDRFKISSLCSYLASGHQTWESSCEFQLLAQGIFSHLFYVDAN